MNGSWHYGIGILVMVLLGCGKETPAPSGRSPSQSQELLDKVVVDVHARRPAVLLSEYRLFTDLKNQVPNQGVIPYKLNSSQFVDYAISHHYLYLPPGTQATYHDDQVFSFPVGTVLIQSLGFLRDMEYPLHGERLVETRLLIHLTKGWLAVPYLWNEDGTDARRAVIGGKTQIHWKHRGGKDRSFEYLTPDMNQCKRCHKSQGTTAPIGVRARNLNCQTDAGHNQLSHWINHRLLEGAPESIAQIPRSAVWNDPSSGTLEARARTWLDVNCAHCHNPLGSASVSGLDLTIGQKSPARFGVYKRPVAAGRGSSGYQFSIDPGNPKSSFLLHRIRSTDPGSMMPNVGRTLVDEEGTAMIEQWIAQLPADNKLAQRALNPMKAYRSALQGGDAIRGRKLFYSTAKCSSCHQADLPDDPGIGPSLANIATRSQRDYLLESIVSPSAKIVEKYIPEIIELEQGLVHTGIVVGEDANEVVLCSADGTQVQIPKRSIDQRTSSSVSIMPSMVNILSTQDIADLIEFLTKQKASPSKRSSKR